MVASNNNPIVTFTYDGRNRCVKRVINGTTNYLYYDNWDLIEEYDSNNNLLASYIHGEWMDEVTTKITPFNQIYYHEDAIGSITHLSDANGKLVEQYLYDPFGKVTFLSASNSIIQTSTYANRFLFTGREYYQEIELYNYRNRVYEPKLGRFLQTDPLLFDAEDINFYRYVGNNPGNWVDPLGLFSSLNTPAGVEALAAANGMTVAEYMTEQAAVRAAQTVGRQLAQNGAKSLAKSIRSWDKQIAKHLEKIAKDPNSKAVEHWKKEIENWERLKKAAKELLNKCNESK